MRNFIAQTCGARGGAGLMISGMTDTTVIQGGLIFPGPGTRRWPSFWALLSCR